MAEPKVWVFFYGSYINFAVQREVDLVPEQWEVPAPRPADNAYVERIAGPARDFGFPGWYIARLESFRA